MSGRATSIFEENARRAVARNAMWYHVMEVAPGVVTPGVIDHRSVARRILPRTLAGRRALDIGTFDGFWAFELERLGAEVVAMDLPEFSTADLPPLNRERLEAAAHRTGLELGRGFRIASELLDSKVEYVQCPLAQLSPGTIGGKVDFVFSGDVLLHLRDPVGALERIADVLEPRGRLLVYEPFSLPLTFRSPGRPAGYFQPVHTDFNWWLPSLGGLRAWLVAAGFRIVRSRGLHRPRAREDMTQWHVALTAGLRSEPGAARQRRSARASHLLATVAGVAESRRNRVFDLSARGAGSP